jgi:hypothetical protein
LPGGSRGLGDVYKRQTQPTSKSVAKPYAQRVGSALC